MGASPIATLEVETLRGDLIWVFGSEDRGLRTATRRQLDAAVGIPESGRVASLSVAAAAAYLLLRTAEIRASKLRA
jgi:tRNA G18 (ribose-2'-O)-methylase SpoU